MKMIKREEVYNDDGFKAFIFLRDNKQYYLNISEPNHRIRLSLHTNDLLKARPKAYKMIDDYKSGIIEQPTFERVAKQFIQTVQSPTRQKWCKERLKAVFYKAFGKMKINDIKTKHIRELIDKRLKEVKPVSINKEMNVLNQIFKYAQQKAYIKEPPIIEHLKEETTKREAFTVEEVEEILAKAEQRAMDINNKNVQYNRTILYYFMKFLTETGIRNSEARSIKFNGICKDTAKLTSSKTKVRDIFLSPEALKTIELLKDTYNHYGINYNDDSYIFLNYRGQQLGNPKKGFNSLLADTSMADKVGKNLLTQYSFRHFFITESLKKGIPITSIAIQCSTSIEMIQKNYNHLTIHQVKKDFK